MAVEYSVETCRKLAEQFQAARLHRPMRIQRYEPGDELSYEVTGVVPDRPASVRLTVDKFVGGGFAGQVYRVKVLSVDAPDGEIPGLEVGRLLAVKILIPPSNFSLLFRNVIYAIGFQGPFQLQVNPAAARAGALWQKFIRHGAKIRLGNEQCVNDIIATFVDHSLGSCGELSEWVDGRIWLLEVDDRLDLLKQWKQGKPVDTDKLNSPEYRSKRVFMAEFVKLLHEVGAPEFARQYEWSTCKSQPNCLKRVDSGNDPESGLVAVDFRAGLALLPFLPMSPGDFKLIIKGLARGSLVQFDRGSLNKLEQFIDQYPEEFADMREAFEQLKQVEAVYRDSLPDITHNHVRLLYSRKLWSTIFDSAVTGWQVRNITDDDCAKKLGRGRLGTLVFFLIGLLPFLGKFVRRLWGRADYRKHYGKMFTSPDYFRRAVRGRIAEKVTLWHRRGRVDENRTLKLAQYPILFFAHLPLSILPVGLHRLLTDSRFVREKLSYIFVRPLRLYFNAAFREQWLRDMVSEGKKNHLVTDEDAGVILSQLKEPYIQKYLKSLAVHVCTLPVTQIVSFIVAWVYVRTHPEMSNAESAFAAGAIVGLFQITPISPGSLCRGFYVLYLVIRERNFKDYNIAVFLGFFKYVGYLAFPIQMAYHYPVLARFMAGHWATGAVHIVPVFGEKGALMEHGVFALFYNLPLTIRRRMGCRAEKRATLKPRCWHLIPCAIAGAALFAVADQLYLQSEGILPSLKNVWYLTVGVPLLAGAMMTITAGGTALGRRIVQAALCGIAIGTLYACVHTVTVAQSGIALGIMGIVKIFIWPMFIFSIFSAIGAILTELQLPEPSEKSGSMG
ncbi:MAG: hypothetical protein KAJ46_02185 [Sedimentisphaerales bacterium]|nr:hypothetical protein [Sedimentisphaerales bacterium]